MAPTTSPSGAPTTIWAWSAKIGQHLADRAQDLGLIIRPLMDSIAFCPPLIITEKQIGDMLSRFEQALEETAEWAKAEGLASAA